MGSIVRSARGDMVDFGLLRIKHAQENAPVGTGKKTNVLVRNENFIANKQAAAKAVADSKEALTAAMEETADPAQEPVRKIIKKKQNA